MKLISTLLSIASARNFLTESSDSLLEADDRIWTPDTTFREEVALTIGQTHTWTVPVSGDDGKYFANQYYRIYVTSPENTAIRVSFGSSFDVELPDVTGCSNDAAMVFNGPDGNNEMARYCGGAVPEPVLGTRQDMTLVFKTNENELRHGGFTATFEVVDLDQNIIEWNKIHNAYETLKNEIFEEHDYKNDNIQNKKSNFITRIFRRFVWMKDNSNMICASPADVGGPVDFVEPVIDLTTSESTCASLGNFIESIRSFHYSYVCMDNLNFDVIPGLSREEKRERNSKIPAKTKKMLLNQARQFTDQKFHAMGCLLE